MTPRRRPLVAKAHAVVMLAAALLGCQSKATGDAAPESSAKPTVFARTRVDASAQNDDFSFTVASFEQCDVAYQSARDGNVKLDVEIAIGGVGEAAVAATPFYLRLIGADHAEWLTTVAGCHKPLHASEVSRGDKATGWVTFEIPVTAHDLALDYAPFVVGKDESRLRISLGR